METNNWKIEKDLCRCCHTEGSFRNLAEPCTEMGEEEVYCDMLRDCFDIDLTPVPGNLCAPTYTICDTCIKRLRDGAMFKKQVLLCEKKFREMYNRNIIIAAAPSFFFDVKQEPDPSDEYVKYEMMQTEEDDESDGDKDSIDIKCNDTDQSDDEDDFKLSLLETALRKGSVGLRKSKVTRNKTKPTKPKKPQRKYKKRKVKTAADSDKADGDKADGDKTDGDEANGDEELPKKKEKPTEPVFNYKPYYKIQGKEFLCLKCGERFKKIVSLRTHLRSKHVAVYKCPCCEESFHTPSLRIIHKLEEHNIDERYKCNACEKAFTVKKTYESHIKGFHKMGPRIQCEHCDYVAHLPSVLKRHSLKHKAANFNCKYCKKAFKRRSNMIFHERIHTGDKRKVCKECGQKFVQKASLNYHMAKHHPGVDF